jgi:hypothetical protein
MKNRLRVGRNVLIGRRSNRTKGGIERGHVREAGEMNQIYSGKE